MKTVFSQNANEAKPLVVAHRGGSLTAPENTLAAFKNALNIGVDRIELDVQLSKDDIVIVIHDEKINRTTNGKGVIRFMDYSQIGSYDAGCWFSDHFKGEKIPSLEEVMTLVKGKSTLLIEIKNQDNLYEGIEQEVVKLIHKHNATSWCVVQSFNYGSLLKIHELDPDIRTGWLAVKPPTVKIINKKIDISFISEININQRFASKKAVDFIHGLNKKVFVWTVNKPARMKKIIQHGVDGIITDDPKTLKELLSN